MKNKPFGWFGGKHYMLKNLLPLIPPHNVYVEVFGGSAALLFAKKPEISKLEVYNDLDPGLTHFFRVLRDQRKCGQLKRLLDITPYSRFEYDYCRQNYQAELDPIERARMWYVLAVMSFGGLWNNNWGYDRKLPKTTKSYFNKVRRFRQFQKRLELVQIDGRDFRRIFKAYDSPETFFIVDPPYPADTRKSGKYQIELTIDDHRDLINILRKIQGKVILCSYPNRQYSILTHSEGWNTKQFDKVCRSSNSRTVKNRSMLKRTEMIWYNYEE